MSKDWASSSRQRWSLSFFWRQRALERTDLTVGAGVGAGKMEWGVSMSKVMTKWSDDAWSWVFQLTKVTGPREATVVSIAEGLSNRWVAPRKEARVAEPSLRIRAVGQDRTASMSARPAGFGSLQ